MCNPPKGCTEQNSGTFSSLSRKLPLPVLRVVEVYDGREGPAEYPEARSRRPGVHPLAQAGVRQRTDPKGHQGQEQQLW